MLCHNEYFNDGGWGGGGDNVWGLRDEKDVKWRNPFRCCYRICRSRKVGHLSSQQANGTPVWSVTVLPDNMEIVVKTTSSTTTSEKDIDNPENRQQFSSGSESSGYFTPPPETHHKSNDSPDFITPSLTLEISPQPERFVRIETPLTIESEPESFDNEEPADETPTEEPENVSRKSKFRASTSLSSLNFVERTLSKNEATNSLEFSKVAFENPEASRRQIDVKIVTHVQRKNVSSAPSLNDLSSFTSNRPSTVKITLPGSCGESLNEAETIDELFKKTPEKNSKSSFERKKSSKYGTGKYHDEPGGDRPFAKPREAFHDICAQLESTDWEVTMKGLQGLVRLIRHHKDVVENQMHAVCVLLGKHVRNLRSQVARNACNAATELAKNGRRPLEIELDELATPLLHRTADTNKFLRNDANAALDEMCTQLSVPKLVAVITYRGSSHQHAVVRSASARLLCNIVQRLGSEKVFQLPRETRDKILLAGANGLMEGSLETRQHAKMLLGSLAEHSQFQKAMAEAVPASIVRHIEKTIKLLLK